MCAGEDGDVRDLRDGQAHVSGICDAVRRPEAGVPIIQGHENVGTIAAIGGYGRYADFEGVAPRVGDRVVVGANVSCRECY